jgi:hypothetical protein
VWNLPPRDLTFFVLENLKELGLWMALGDWIVLIFVGKGAEKM